MFKMMTKFEVEDFNKWLAIFNSGSQMRMDAGAKDVQIFRGTGDMNMVTVIMVWDDPEKAKAFSQSPELRDAQQKAGVLSKPETFILQSM